MNVHALIIIGCILVGLVWIIGSFSMLHEMLDTGKSLKNYREQYGKDLGMLICCTYRGLMIFAWPIMGVFGFTTGLIRDIIKLVMN